MCRKDPRMMRVFYGSFIPLSAIAKLANLLFCRSGAFEDVRNSAGVENSYPVADSQDFRQL